MTQITPSPFTFSLDKAESRISCYEDHVERRLSDMRGQYLDQAAYERRLAQEDSILYQVYANNPPTHPGELPHGLSVLRPGKIGDEYFMTKGHFHSLLETAEVYHCLQGRGAVVMETPEGDWSVKELLPGRVLYVPPRWAHRSVNTSPDTDLVTFFVYPGNAGHNYGTIERYGFRKLIVEQEGRPEVIDNPRWLPPDQRG